MYDEISLDQIAERIANDDYHVLKIRSFFPLEKIRLIIDEALEQFEFKKKDHYRDYKGLGLQYEDDANPYYDAVDAISTISNGTTPVEKRKLGGSFIKKNSVGKKLEEIFNFFEPTVYLIRGRILVSEPGNSITEHTDGFCSATMHYAVQTHPDARLFIDRTPYHIPSDGSCYLINASRPHFITNQSPIDRIHIVFPINPGCFKSVTRSQFDKMLKYYQQFGIDPARFKHQKIIEDL